MNLRPVPIRPTPRVVAIRNRRADAQRWRRESLAFQLIREPLALCNVAMKPLDGVEIWASTTQVRIICHSGPIDPWLEKLIDWNTSDDLPAALTVANQRIGHSVYEEMKQGKRAFGDTGPYTQPDFGLPFFTLDLMLATRGFMAVRGRDGLHCQVFRDGWVATPPFVADTPKAVGLVLSAEFNPGETAGVPLRRSDLENAIKAEGVVPTRFEWVESYECPYREYLVDAWRIVIEPDRHVGHLTEPESVPW